MCKSWIDVDVRMAEEESVEVETEEEMVEAETESTKEWWRRSRWR